jgi:hypothetical protein
MVEPNLGAMPQWESSSGLKGRRCHLGTCWCLSTEREYFLSFRKCYAVISNWAYMLILFKASLLKIKMTFIRVTPMLEGGICTNITLRQIVVIIVKKHTRRKILRLEETTMYVLTKCSKLKPGCVFLLENLAINLLFLWGATWQASFSSSCVTSSRV